MASTIVIAQDYGSSYGGYSQEIAKSLFALVSVDDGTANKNSYPLRIPEVGIIYSYEVYLRCRVDIAPVTKCFNFKVWYSSGTGGTGQELTVNSDLVSEYFAPVNIESTKGTRVDFTTKDSEVNSISLDGELVNIGDYSSYLVFQLSVSDTAEPSVSEVEFLVQWDEV